jgi:carbohydrate-selective porin OprB
VSADQRLGDGITLWGRYGHGMQGNPAFDRALTLGAEFSGNYWDRGADGVGLAVGWLAPSDSYKAANPTLSGAEQLGELYYRWRVNPQFELSPDYQFIRRAGADGSADDAHILGLRAQLTF